LKPIEGTPTRSIGGDEGPGRPIRPSVTKRVGTPRPAGQADAKRSSSPKTRCTRNPKICTARATTWRCFAFERQEPAARKGSICGAKICDSRRASPASQVSLAETWAPPRGATRGAIESVSGRAERQSPSTWRAHLALRGDGQDRRQRGSAAGVAGRGCGRDPNLKSSA